LVIANAAVVDGTGAAAFPGWVAITGDRIERVGRIAGHDLAGEPVSPLRIDAGGHVVAPGFIDVHNHSDLSPLVTPGMDSYLRQGVTTLVSGNCGSSAWPPAGGPECAELCGLRPDEIDVSWKTAGELFERLNEARPSINVATLIGHGALRQEVMGMQARAPSASELTTMKRLLAEGLEAGAVGLSTGLVYAPGFHASTDEVVELASVLAEYGGIYASHIRAEGELLYEAVDEALEIGRRAGAPVHISHLKLETDLVWGAAADLLAKLDAARAEGADVSCDQYPYTAYETTFASFLPPWAPVEELAGIVARPHDRERLVAAVAEGEPGWQSSIRGVGWDRVVVTTHATERDVSGRSIADIAELRGEDPFDTAFSLLVADPSMGIIGHAMLEEDVRTILAREDVMVASDGTAISPDGPLSSYSVHPRYYGTFPRVLGHYVRDERILSLEAAVRKMTLLPAERFLLGDRGRIAAGAVADLVIFDPETISDPATYEHPHVFATGIDRVVVAGQTAWPTATEESNRAGRVVRRGGEPPGNA
jgi:N-acyl-D-aspartate/D-glutamate deacylase